MLKNLLASFQNFRKSFQLAEMEIYILSRHPQNAADIDRLSREYQFKQNSRYFSRLV
jgi:hypothetical protein